MVSVQCGKNTRAVIRKSNYIDRPDEHAFLYHLPTLKFTRHASVTRHDEKMKQVHSRSSFVGSIDYSNIHDIQNMAPPFHFNPRLGPFVSGWYL